MDDILNTFPGPMTNNSREIVRKAMDDFKEYPCDRNARRLEEYGIPVDFDSRFDHMGSWVESDDTKDYER